MVVVRLLSLRTVSCGTSTAPLDVGAPGSSLGGRMVGLGLGLGAEAEAEPRADDCMPVLRALCIEPCEGASWSMMDRTHDQS